MNQFTRIVIIYNPNSTGDSEANAKKCEQALKNRNVSAEILVRPTEYKAHAEEIVLEYADDASTLIISSSGDGGYNEVVNGVLEHDGKAAMAVLPSGNANDHYNSIGTDDFIGSVAEGKVRAIEAINVSATIDGKQWQRYAHSYVGLGLTPKVGKELTEHRPNVVTEKLHVLKHLIRFSHVTILIDGQKRRFGNLICATVGRMSKVVRLDQTATLNDGKMEVYETDYVSIISMLRLIFRSGLGGLEHSSRTETYEFRTIRRTLIQLDGEVFMLDGDSDVSVTCLKGAIRTI